MAQNKPNLTLLKFERPAWQATHGTTIAGQAEMDGPDHAAHLAERKWGVDRLRLLVTPELREKFDRQRYLYSQAVWHGDLETLRQQSRRMAAAWKALDAYADSIGAPHLAAEVFEIPMPDGTVAAIVPLAAHSRAVQPEGRYVTIYTADEIGRLLAGFPELCKIKHAIPGATVTGARSTFDDPLHRFPSSEPKLNDPLPW
jgi:hypothetical protein